MTIDSDKIVEGVPEASAVNRDYRIGDSSWCSTGIEQYLVDVVPCAVAESGHGSGGQCRCPADVCPWLAGSEQDVCGVPGTDGGGGR